MIATPVDHCPYRILANRVDTNLPVLPPGSFREHVCYLENEAEDREHVLFSAKFTNGSFPF
jgi:hypothetical protein